jgi:hypothetical protein
MVAMNRTFVLVVAVFLIALALTAVAIGYYWVNMNNPKLLSKDQALSIGMPLIQKYAQENNRTIQSVNATLSNKTQNPQWNIMAHFVWTNPNITLNGTLRNDPQAYVYGFDVLIKADNGQVFYSGPQGIM